MFRAENTSASALAIHLRTKRSISSDVRPVVAGSTAAISVKCSSTRGLCHTRRRINRNDGRPIRDLHRRRTVNLRSSLYWPRRILKSRNSNVDRQRHVHRDRVGVVGHGAFCPIDSGQGRAYIAAGYAYRSAFHRALCLPTVRAGGPPRGQEDWGQGRL